MNAPDRFTLKGRRALVTGASSGLGRHFAGTLAEAGATVIVAARSVDKLADTVRRDPRPPSGAPGRCASTSRRPGQRQGRLRPDRSRGRRRRRDRQQRRPGGVAAAAQPD
jgi:NAD(P)-dependent dehydrogenase (short-subunit alcohol dehydrogenase family)